MIDLIETTPQMDVATQDIEHLVVVKPNNLSRLMVGFLKQPYPHRIAAPAPALPPSKPSLSLWGLGLVDCPTPSAASRASSPARPAQPPAEGLKVP